MGAALPLEQFLASGPLAVAAVANLHHVVSSVGAAEQPRTLKESDQIRSRGRFRPKYPRCLLSGYTISATAPKRNARLVARYADPENELAAKVLRLQTERENLVYVLSNTELSDEHRTLLQKQLMSVQNALVMLTGGISVN